LKPEKRREMAVEERTKRNKEVKLTHEIETKKQTQQKIKIQLQSIKYNHSSNVSLPCTSSDFRVSTGVRTAPSSRQSHPLPPASRACV
jgi:hypothetical protein